MFRHLLSGSFVALLAVTISLWARSPTVTLDLPDTPYRYDVELPEHFVQAGRNDDNTPPDNPLTDHGATLGRVLFYDTRLSANNTTSCGSCHLQAHAFADPRPASTGFRGARTDRRAMPLVNLRYYKRARFFWDERAGNLEEMVLHPIQSRIEMGQDLKTVVALLARDSTYRGLFARAFGDPAVTEQRIGRALAQFVRSMVSYRSPYDAGRARVRSAHDDFDNFTRQENRGKALFLRHCANCHMRDGNEHLFVPEPANTGLRANNPAADGGVGDVTLHMIDLGAFKSPSLRNVEVTAPYGHDGRFATLDAVINHYSENAISDGNFGYAIPIGPLKFTASEKAALTAFLKTLTDRAFLSDAKFANPIRTSAVQRVDAALVIDAAISRVPKPDFRRAGLNRGPVFDRLVWFDANEDGRIARDELPERMEGLVDRGDTNQDGVLTADEVASLVNVRLSANRRSMLITHKRPTLVDIVADLKLPAETHNRALGVLNAPPNVNTLSLGNKGSLGDLYADLRTVLNGEDYENFVAAAARAVTSPFMNVGGTVHRMVTTTAATAP